MNVSCRMIALFNIFRFCLGLAYMYGVILFLLKLNSKYIHSITFIQYIHPSSFAEVPLHLLLDGQLSGKNLPGVTSQESNSGLSYSKPTQYHSAELHRTLIDLRRIQIFKLNKYIC